MALFTLSIALQYASAAVPKTALATQECESYAIFTSDPQGETNNQNLYDSKPEVWLNGGPASAGGNLTAGTVFYYQTQEPDGTPLSEIRSVTVLGDGPHAGRFFVGLAPFDTTSNNGGEYKVVVSTHADLAQGACTKSDNFKVDDPGNLKITKDLQGGPGDFGTDFDITVDCGLAGTFEVTIGFPEPGEVTIPGIDALAECSIEEIIQENDPPLGYYYGPPTYSGNPATIVSGETVTIAITNHLVEKPRPAISIVKSVALDGDGPWVNELTVTTGTTVHYRITIANEGNVPLTDVSLSDNKFDLEECDVPSTLAVGASFDCDYTDVAETGTLVNTATVDSEETGSEDDDATVNASPAPTLTIEKSNDAPLVNGLPTAEAGDTVTYTLDYSFTGDEVTDATITDVVPAGLTYVADSASSDGQFTFVGYNSTTRTLSWAAESVEESGSVHYDTTVDENAVGLLKNLATIDSAETEPDTDQSDVTIVAGGVEAETSVPTPPQTDIGSIESSVSGGSMLLALLALAAIALAVVFVAPTPTSIRKRMDR